DRESSSQGRAPQDRLCLLRPRHSGARCGGTRACPRIPPGRRGRRQHVSPHGARREHYTFRKGGGRMKRMLALLLLASPALAAPKIENLSVKASTKSPEVEIALAVSKSGGNCDVRVDFGDGRGRTVDFGVATSRTLKYTYRKGGNFKVSAKGA